MDEVHLVMKSTRTGSEVEAAYEDLEEAFHRAGSAPLEYVKTLPVIRKGSETLIPSSSSTPDGGTGPA